jgi:hypothetical protein
LQTEKESATAAVIETVVVCAIYIGLAQLAVAKDIFGASGWFQDFSPIESDVAAGFTTGAIAQLALVLALISTPVFPHARKAVLTLFQPAARGGWAIALSVLAVEVVALYFGWIRDLSKLADTSVFGISMSLVPALDGITQEIVFRGYVILRLASNGTSRFGQIFLSGILFAAIHFSYVTELDPSTVGSTILSLMPLIGTFGLGAAWAFAFQQSGYKLLPVVTSHVLVIILVQPWLAISFAT